jgi:hypothetical protein
LKWGTVGGGKREWRGKGERGRSVYKQPGTRVDRDRITRKEAFQVSKRDSGTGEGFFRQRGRLPRGLSRGYQRVIKGFVPCALI